MKICSNCGNQVADDVAFCSACGKSTAAGDYQPAAPQPKVAAPSSSANKIGWGALGCCVPAAGLVLYIIWKEIYRETATSALL